MYTESILNLRRIQLILRVKTGQRRSFPAKPARGDWKGRWVAVALGINGARKMSQVYIDNSRELVIMDGKEVPRLLLWMIRGTIGKCFVVKHYRDKKKRKKVVVTRYPDMSGIVASEKQRVRRDLFKEAVVYAQWILSDAERKEAFRKTLPRKKRKHVYQAAIRLYMRMQGDKQWLRKQLAVRGMMSTGRREIVEFVNGQWSMVNIGGVHAGGVNGCEQVGGWKVVWQKEEAVELEVEEGCKMKDGCLAVLRI